MISSIGVVAAKGPPKAGSIASWCSVRIERRGNDDLAALISPAAIFPCAGSRDEASEPAPAAALDNGGWRKVTRLRREAFPPERCRVGGLNRASPVIERRDELRCDVSALIQISF